MLGDVHTIRFKLPSHAAGHLHLAGWAAAGAAGDVVRSLTGFWSAASLCRAGWNMYYTEPPNVPHMCSNTAYVMLSVTSYK